MPLAGIMCIGLSKKERFLWLIVSLAALSALLYEWQVVISGYVQNPVRSDVFYKEPRSMRFPSLLFCHRQFYLNESEIGATDNRVGKNVAKYMRIVTNPTGADSSASGPPVSIFGSDQDQNKAQADYLAYVAKFHNNPWAAFENVMLDCVGLVKQCSLGGQNFTSVECCQQWSVRRLTPVGPCLAVQPPDQEMPSSNGAFQIDFQLPAIANDQTVNFGGFDLYIGDVIGKPMTAALALMDEDSYTVQLSASIYKNHVSSQCNGKLKSIFRQFDFIAMDEAMRCTARAVRALCQCDPVFKVQLDAVSNVSQSSNQSIVDIDSGSSHHVSPNVYQFCDFTNVLRCALPLLNSTRDPSNFTRVAQRLLGYAPCKTMPPCVDTRYHFAVTEFREMTPTSGSYKSRLRIYYETFVLTEIDQRRSYTFHDVIINLGGAFSFWIVSLCALMCAVNAIKWCICGGTKHQNGQMANGVGRDRIVDIEVRPATGQANPPVLVPVRKTMGPVEHFVEPVEDIK